MSSTNRQQPRKPQRRFQFIDNSNIGANGSNSTQVRRHVMQEYMREKRWESRARAEGEVHDCPTQPHLQSQTSASSPPRKSPTKPRSRNRVLPNDQSAKGANLHTSLASSLQPGIFEPQPHVHSLQDSTPPVQETIEEIPRTFPPTKHLDAKPLRRGFYLTPQAFAAIASVGDVMPLTPASTITSGESLSPTSSLSQPMYPTSSRDSFSPEPCSMLSAARTDPFSCLPLTLSRRDQELFDFYATVMPACSYGFERRKPRAHNWYLSVFIPEAMKSPVAFQNTILVHAANTQAWVQNLSDTPLAIEHRARASQMLSEHFQAYPFDTSDAAISSTISAAALEDFDPRTERRKYAWMHWNAVMQKIRDRGGPLALEQSKSLRMLINWSDYIFSGYNGVGPSFFFDHRMSMQYQNEEEAELVGRDELAQQCEDFIIFLKCAESLALVAANLQSNQATRKGQPQRYSAFKNGEPLYKLLASPNGPRYTKTGQLKQIISRLAALMTINVAIWEYRYSPRASEEFFEELVENVRNNDLDQHISVEALLQILLSGSEHPNLVHTERPWLVGRLLKVAKRLSRRSWENLNDFLLHCLTLDASLRPTMETWQHELKAEILAAPLASYVLPLMRA